MESSIAQNLRPEFEPVAVVWSDTIPDRAIQFRKGRFGCVLHLFAAASKRGRIAGGNRESIVCAGGRAALGFAMDLDATDELLDRYSAVFSKGIRSTKYREAYQVHMDSAPQSRRDLYEFGERRHGNQEMAKQWILNGLPRCEVPHEYVVFKPLSRTDPDENLRAVIFLVSPVELAGLVTLAGSTMPGTDIIQAAQGPDCAGITAFPCAQADRAEPRAVLGMLGVDGREVMRKRFRDDILTLALPAPLFGRMEEEAADCVFQTPAWRGLARGS